MTDIFDEQPFYELMQQYRHAPSQESVIPAFEEVKDYIRLVIDAKHVDDLFTRTIKTMESLGGYEAVARASLRIMNRNLESLKALEAKAVEEIESLGYIKQSNLGVRI